MFLVRLCLFQSQIEQESIPVLGCQPPAYRLHMLYIEQV